MIRHVTLLAQPITDEAGLIALAAEWRELHESSEAGAFQSHEWQLAWWRHFGATDRALRLHVVAYRDGGRLVGLAPLVIRQWGLGRALGLRTAQWLGDGVSDALDLLARPSYEAQVASAFAATLGERALCDRASFVDVPDGAILRKYAFAPLQQLGFQISEEARDPSPRTMLAASWSETAATFEDSRRKRLAYLDRKLKKQCRVDVIDVDIDTFIEMHQRRWESVGDDGALKKDRERGFHREVAAAFRARGWLELTLLTIDERPAFALYGFTMSKRFQFYLSGVGADADLRRHSPGLLHHMYTMQRMIGEGVQVYDFLRGTERYKYDLGAADVPNWGATVQRPAGAALRGKLAIWRLRQTAGNRAKALLRQWARRGYDSPKTKDD